MKKLLILFLFLSVLTGCNAVKTANTLSSAAELKASLQDANKLLTISHEAYTQNKAAFDSTEQRLMNRGFERVILARNELNALFYARNLDSVVTHAHFIQTWADAREGYQLIRGVLKSHKNISEKHQILIEQAHKKVTYLDSLVDDLTPQSKEIDYQSIATIISATATLVGNVRPIVSN